MYFRCVFHRLIVRRDEVREFALNRRTRTWRLCGQAMPLPTTVLSAKQISLSSCANIIVATGTKNDFVLLFLIHYFMLKLMILSKADSLLFFLLICFPFLKFIQIHLSSLIIVNTLIIVHFLVYFLVALWSVNPAHERSCAFLVWTKSSYSVCAPLVALN